MSQQEIDKLVRKMKDLQQDITNFQDRSAKLSGEVSGMMHGNKLMTQIASMLLQNRANGDDTIVFDLKAGDASNDAYIHIALKSGFRLSIEQAARNVEEGGMAQPIPPEKCDAKQAPEGWSQTVKNQEAQE